MPQNYSSFQGTNIRAEMLEPNEGQELEIMTSVQRRLDSEQTWHVISGVFMHEFCRHLSLRNFKMKLKPTKCAFGVASGKFLGFMVNQRGIEVNPEKIQALVNIKSPKNVKEIQ